MYRSHQAMLVQMKAERTEQNIKIQYLESCLKEEREQLGRSQQLLSWLSFIGINSKVEAVEELTRSLRDAKLNSSPLNSMRASSPIEGKQGYIIILLDIRREHTEVATLRSMVKFW